MSSFWEQILTYYYTNMEILWVKSCSANLYKCYDFPPTWNVGRRFIILWYWLWLWYQLGVYFVTQRYSLCPCHDYCRDCQGMTGSGALRSNGFGQIRVSAMATQTLCKLWWKESRNQDPHRESWSAENIRMLRSNGKTSWVSREREAQREPNNCLSLVNQLDFRNCIPWGLFIY